jgi:hypothetical protein
MNDFFFQKGPVITNERWIFPENEMITAFLKIYIPEFKRIFNESPNYELYFLGSARDRFYKYKQTYISKYSDDVDLAIYTNGDIDEKKIYDALIAATKIGFLHKLLIDISCKRKPSYMYYKNNCDVITENEIKSNMSNKMFYIYRLNPMIYRTKDILRKTYYNCIENVCLVKCTTSNQDKVIGKIRLGWKYYKPTRIA